MSDVELELRKLIAAYDLVLDDVSTQRAAADAIDPIRRRLRAQGIRPCRKPNAVLALRLRSQAV